MKCIELMYNILSFHVIRFFVSFFVLYQISQLNLGYMNGYFSIISHDNAFVFLLSYLFNLIINFFY